MPPYTELFLFGKLLGELYIDFAFNLLLFALVLELMLQIGGLPGGANIG